MVRLSAHKLAEYENAEEQGLPVKLPCKVGGFRMTRDKFIRKLLELDRVLLEDMPIEELTDYAREQAHYNLENLIDIIKENEE